RGPVAMAATWFFFGLDAYLRSGVYTSAALFLQSKSVFSARHGPGRPWISQRGLAGENTRSHACLFIPCHGRWPLAARVFVLRHVSRAARTLFPQLNGDCRSMPQRAVEQCKTARPGDAVGPHSRRGSAACVGAPLGRRLSVVFPGGRRRTISSRFRLATVGV